MLLIVQWLSTLVNQNESIIYFSLGKPSNYLAGRRHSWGFTTGPKKVPDGLSADGLLADGLSVDGLSADGLSAEGLSTEGLSTDGYQQMIYQQMVYHMVV